MNKHHELLNANQQGARIRVVLFFHKVIPTLYFPLLRTDDPADRLSKGYPLPKGIVLDLSVTFQALKSNLGILEQAMRLFLANFSDLSAFGWIETIPFRLSHNTLDIVDFLISAN